MQAVAAVLQAPSLDEETVGWATRVLQGANHKPLRQLIEELIAATGEKVTYRIYRHLMPSAWDRARTALDQAYLEAMAAGPA